MRYSWIVVLSLTLLSCATTDHYAAVTAQTLAWERVELARSAANARKYEALIESARGGSDLARVAVAMALAGQGIGNYQATPLPIIPDPSETAFRWASIIVPAATNIGLAGFSYKLGVAQSDNARLQTEASYRAIGAGYMSNAQIASYIQAPQANVTNTSTSTSTSTSNVLSGTGSLGSGSYAVRNCNGGVSGAVSTGNSGSAIGGNC